MHRRDTSSERLCKVYRIEDTKAAHGGKRANGGKYERIFVIGDGGNDFCPCKLLTENDVIFPRKGYRLIKKLERLSKSGDEEPVLASIVPWEDGEDLLASFKQVAGLR
ncbi:hypothetical protein BSL78_04614 [Apostichopus japonicus]|uniref:Uncharacterized protein n=1 Tax=Stichopus japonicus TaxID=307972 RepID=A0A2G8LE06_STIJA|nr:hypothetical protein BSL78_04614 [Apostichopus japonicus]